MDLLDLAQGPIEYCCSRPDPARHPGGGSGRGSSSIVLLHEGLGSVSLWRDFPDRVAQATGRHVMAYSRYGYGRSGPVRGPRRADFMHDEALVVLPQVLDALRLERPVLLGHSDGASIAIIHAGGSGRAVAGLVLLAPHVIVEERTVASIASARAAYDEGGLRARLARHHDDVDGMFRGWSEVWLGSCFPAWNIEEFLPRLTVPVLVIQGEDDEYGTMDQVDRIVRGASGAEVEVLELAECGHSPHRDRPAEVLAAVQAFVGRL